MNITIHCGGMPFDGRTILTQSLGGSESAAYYMARELVSRGHNVTLFTSISAPSEQDGVRYIPAGAPTQQSPLGEDFHHYALNTPVDVTIIQRHPQAFLFPWASKINLLWSHDLATAGTRDAIHAQLPFVDGILAVSQWHKEQIVDSWEVNPDIVMPIQNGVARYLYHNRDLADSPLRGNDQEKIRLIYSSRPERGLENLVKPGGIMEKLGDGHHLYVCNYDNTTEQMAGYYAALYRRCEELPNVTVLGNLTKAELANAQLRCDVCVYPTAFEETSCITAMECMAAGLPMITSAVGALPETCEDAGVTLIPTLPNDPHYRGAELRVAGKVDIDAFVAAIPEVLADYGSHVRAQHAASEKFTWSEAAGMLVGHIDDIFGRARTATSIARGYMRTSDIYALRRQFTGPKGVTGNAILRAVRTELEECYGFMRGGWAEHYERYYTYERMRGVEYGPEDLTGNQRFEYVASLLNGLPDGATVLDYGCAHGHYTVNLAKRYPGLRFVGVDITPSNVATATQWARDAGVADRTRFVVGDICDGAIPAIDELGDQNAFDCIIAAEVLEHMPDPGLAAGVLDSYLHSDGSMIITVPYGPWEAQGYLDHWPWRAHVHHLERQDLVDLYGHHRDFRVVVVPAGKTAQGEPLGSYVATWKKPQSPNGAIDYDRKYSQAIHRQTLSLCMIAKDAQDTIERCLASVASIVDEVIIGIDDTTTDDTALRAKDFCAAMHIPCKIFQVQSPLEQGFDAARGATIDEACGDWILWLDADEILDNADSVARYLRHNQYQGYALAQHHFSMEPAGIMKTDYPVRIFRNRIGVRFYGVVHEHPEVKMNEGVGHVMRLPTAEIAHYGYQNEAVRRARFARNIPLLVRDREKYPNRNLGKYLWLRDLAQMNGFEMERNGGRVTDAMVARAVRGVELFEELVANPCTLRMAVDGLDFYTDLARVLGGGFDFSADIGAVKIRGHFHSQKILDDLLDRLVDEEVKHDKQKYR